MKHVMAIIVLTAIARTGVAAPATMPTALPRSEWGAPMVDVQRTESGWTIAGQKHRVLMDARRHTIEVHAGPAVWNMVAPEGANDLVVRASGGEEQAINLHDARKIDVEPYDTGFKTGIKITLADWEKAPVLRIFLTIALEGKDEDLCFDIAAEENGAVVRRLDWPPPINGGDVDCTLLSNHRGVLLPRDWPKAYFPIRSTDMGGNPKATDTSEVQSNVIESWSMSWWGFQKGASAAMVIVETPDDAAYQFDHPAGGPTTIGPRWRMALGSLRYPRACRMCFIDRGNYVDLAKRYRRYVMDRGQFVSLSEKICRKPIVKELIATPLVRVGILTDIVKTSLRYNTTQPEKNYRLTTFDERAKQFREWKARGLDRLHVCLTGWPNKGYDRQHPDELPPAPVAGGWEGMKRCVDAAHEIGYLISLHDQYRDYYTDAPSFDTQFAIHEEDDRNPSSAFPGSRFGQWKKGVIPYMNNWDGGEMSYLNNRFMLGHLVKNYTGLFDHGIKPDGIYLDVFGYVPPDEDFNPQHPSTRTDAIRGRTLCYTWSRNNIGFIGTEAGCDWTVPYADVLSPLRSSKGVPVPLFNLVYHDAVIVPYQPNDLRGFLNGGLPQMFNPADMSDSDLANIRKMAALHKRLALTEMTKHEFLDEKFRRERTTFSDGTTVTVDWDSNKCDIQPELTP
jgi:hypothetical protein